MTAGARTPLGPISCLGNVWVGKCRGTVVGHLGENLFHSKICNPSPPQHPHNPTQHLQYMMLPLWMVICWPFSVCFRGLPFSGNFKTNLGYWSDSKRFKKLIGITNFDPQLTEQLVDLDDCSSIISSRDLKAYLYKEMNTYYQGMQWNNANGFIRLYFFFSSFSFFWYHTCNHVKLSNSKGLTFFCYYLIVYRDVQHRYLNRCDGFKCCYYNLWTTIDVWKKISDQKFFKIG